MQPMDRKTIPPIRLPAPESSCSQNVQLSPEPSHSIIPGRTEDVGVEEARYYMEKLREWYDRSESPSGTPRRSSIMDSGSGVSMPRNIPGPGRTTVSLKMPLKAAMQVKEDQESKHFESKPGSMIMETDPRPPAAALPTIEKMLKSIGKEQLVELALQYHRILLDLGHLSEAEQLQRCIEMGAQSVKQSVGPTEQVTGIDRLLKDGLLAFLLKLNSFLPLLPTQVIKFRDLTFIAKVALAKDGYETVGSMVNKLFFPCFAERGHPQEFAVLKGCTGYLMPGTLTLVCGPPGCGKSSLHKALAGRLDVSKGTQLSGNVTYNGKGIKDFYLRRVAGYIAQVDRHLPTLTVRETLEFAYQCTSLFDTQARQLIGEVLEQELGGDDLPLQLILHLFGLRNSANTVVGDQTHRGLSGGERHRVTTAEMMLGTFVVFFLDEISTGLDSSATYDIVSALRTFARMRQFTLLLSLLQPAPEVFDLFDRLIVLQEGQIIYQGPREDVLPYFAELGYVKPSYVDVADFLQEVATDDGVQFLQPGSVKLKVEDFVKAYMSSDLYKEVLRVVDSPEILQEIWLEGETPLGLKLRDRKICDGQGNVIEVCELEEKGTTSVPHIQQITPVRLGDYVTGVANLSGRLEYIMNREWAYYAADVVNRVTEAHGFVRLQLERCIQKDDAFAKNMFEKEYVQDLWRSTKTVFMRQAILMIRNTSFIFARNLQVLILGIFTGTLFYQVSDSPKRSAMDLRKSLAFLACMAMSLGSIAQIPTQLDERKVFEKHYAARFFRPKSYVLAGTLSQIPFTILEMTIYTPLIYWLTGLSGAQHGVHYLVYILIVFITALACGALVRFLASISRTRETAAALSGLLIVIFLLFSGFLITKNKVPKWWIWAYYLSPLQWGFTGLVCNEFLSGKYNQPCSNVVDYCKGKMHFHVGEAYLDLYRLPTTYFKGVWISMIVLSSYYVALTCLTFWTVSTIHFDEVKQPSVTRLQSRMTSFHESISIPTLPIIERQDSGVVQREPSYSSQRAQLGDREVDSLVHMESGFTEAKSLRVKTETTISFNPMILSFHQINYEVRVPGSEEPRVLLSNVSGYSRPGTMTALMGSSGAGKTTLLDVLAGRKTIGRINGDILINGYPKVQETFSHISGYVEQNDIHMPFISVKESLEFSAALRLPKTTTYSQRKNFVNEVMTLMELHTVQKKLVGSIGDGGLSVEEAKRLTIGVELVANPSIIFLDEPTSGLDSRAAQIVMHCVQNIVKSGRSVICTIHQPSRRLFLAFDQLLLLRRGGEVAYFGPLGQEGRNLLDYFHSFPGIRQCSENQNPASYMLEIIGAGVGHNSERDFGLNYRESHLAVTNLEELERLRYGKGKLGREPEVKGYAATWSLMYHVVVARQFKTYWRNVAYSFGRMMFSAILALLLGSTFWQMKYNTTPGFVSRLGLIYISIVFVAISNANNVIPQIGISIGVLQNIAIAAPLAIAQASLHFCLPMAVNAERPVYYRERASNMYPLLLYNLSWILAEIPYLCISTLLFCSICFTMCGIATDTASHFFQYWFVFFEYSATITFFGIFLAMVTPNAQTATIIIPVVINLWNMTSGFTIQRSSIPNFWIWLYWMNPTQFALNSLFSIAFFCNTKNGSCSTCSVDGCTECQCVRVEDAGNILAWLLLQNANSLDYGRRFVDMVVLFLFMLLFCVAALVALRFMKFDRR